MANKNTSHLHTPEVRAKRGKAIKAAWRRKKKLLKAQAAAAQPRGGALIPLDVIPGEEPPVLSHAKSVGTGSRTKSDDTKEKDRLDLAKALVATVFKLVNK